MHTAEVLAHRDRSSVAGQLRYRCCLRKLMLRKLPDWHSSQGTACSWCEVACLTKRSGWDMFMESPYLGQDGWRAAASMRPVIEAQAGCCRHVQHCLQLVLAIWQHRALQAGLEVAAGLRQLYRS